MADKAWIVEAVRRYTDASGAAARVREQERQVQAVRESVVGSFWNAFVAECESIVRELDVSIGPGIIRVKTGPDRAIGVSLDRHQARVLLPGDSMRLHLDGIEREKLTGGAAKELVIVGGRLLGAKGETPEELANDVMRVFFERAL